MKRERRGQDGTPDDTASTSSRAPGKRTRSHAQGGSGGARNAGRKPTPTDAADAPGTSGGGFGDAFSFLDGPIPTEKLVAGVEQSLAQLEQAIAARDFAPAAAAAQRIRAVLPEARKRVVGPARSEEEQRAVEELRTLINRHDALGAKVPTGNGMAARANWHAVVGPPNAEPATDEAEPDAPAGDAEPAGPKAFQFSRIDDGFGFDDLSPKDWIEIGIGPVGMWALEQQKDTNLIAGWLYDAIQDVPYLGGLGGGFIKGVYDAGSDFVNGPAELLTKVSIELIELIKTNIMKGGIAAVMQAIDKIDALFKEAKSLVDAAPQFAMAFKQQWTQDDSLARGKFQGHVVGYSLTTLAIMVASAITVPATVPAELQAVIRFFKTVDAFGDVTSLARPLKIFDRIADAVPSHAPHLPAAPHAPDASPAPHAATAGAPTTEDASAPGRTLSVGSETGTVDEAVSAATRPRDAEPPAAASANNVSASFGTAARGETGSHAHSRGNEGTDGRDVGRGQESGDGSEAIDAPDAWATSARRGVEATPDSIRVGDVRMELHPEYGDVLAEVTLAGYAVRPSHGARVAFERIVDDNGTVLEYRRFVEVIPGMRFLDLEHELGHIRQLQRLGDAAMPTETFVRNADGIEKKAENALRSGTMRSEHDSVFEYHNRLAEWVRLAERGASPELLNEHAKGVADWRMWAEAGGLGRAQGRGRFNAWAQSAVPDLPDSERRARALGLDLGRTTWRW